ncbi:MAG: YigZ family protein, partial [Oscillospiraceae bacterium]|nr:YigZ family protein [Oscillospiraceae bacterium]
GEKKFIKRYSDDGEPQGTAGIPILECINKKDITFAVIVVTRFFGGILLGAGGLVRAYIKAASSAIDKSGIIEVVKGSEIDLIISYDLLRKFQYLFSENKIYIEDIVYTDKVEIKCIIESSNIDFFKRIVRENSYGKFNLNCDKEREYFKLGNRLFLNLK